MSAPCKLHSDYNCGICPSVPCFACDEAARANAGVESKSVGCFSHRTTKPMISHDPASDVILIYYPILYNPKRLTGID